MDSGVKCERCAKLEAEVEFLRALWKPAPRSEAALVANVLMIGEKSAQIMLALYKAQDGLTAEEINARTAEASSERQTASIKVMIWQIRQHLGEDAIRTIYLGNGHGTAPFRAAEYVLSSHLRNVLKGHLDRREALR